MLGIFTISLLVLSSHLLLKALSHTGIHVPTGSLTLKILDGVAEEMLFQEVQGFVVLL
jgi:hypothetical protein